MPDMFWSLKLENVKSESKNMPFMVTEHVHLHCQFEADYYKERRLNGSLKVDLQGSHRKGCAEHMPIKYSTIFPEYPVPSYVALHCLQTKLTFPTLWECKFCNDMHSED